MEKDKGIDFVDFSIMLSLFILSIAMTKICVGMSIVFFLFFGAVAFLSLLCLTLMFWEFVRRNQDEEYKRN